MAKQLKLENLSAEDRKALLDQAKEELQSNEARIAADRKAYKQLVNETVPHLFDNLKYVSDELAKAKAETFNGLRTLIELKSDVYGRDVDQYTHSFTTDEGITLVIGCRITDNWDDTVTAGLNKVNVFLETLSKDKDSAFLVGMVRKLLTKDAKGNLKSSRVLQLKKEADQTANAEFIDAIKIIMDAYKPRKGQEFVTARWKDAEGKTQELPLDITSAANEQPIAEPIQTL